MRGPKLCLAVIAPALAVAGSILLPGLARAAQPATCPAPGDEVATVELVTPEAGVEVGGRVEVSGRAEAPTALFQVELFVGDSRKDFAVVDPPATAADFTLVWDTTATKAGPATLRIVACGGSADAGRLIRGTAAVDVQVVAPPAAAAPRVLVDVPDEDQDDRPSPSLVAGAVIAVPAAACLLFAMGRRRQA